MKIEQIRQELKSCIVSTIKENNELHLYASFDILADKIMELIPRWIPVTERLPEDEGFKLVTHNIHTNVTAFASYEHGKWYDKYGDSLMYVDAWMPLPEPYNSEKQ